MFKIPIFEKHLISKQKTFPMPLVKYFPPGYLKASTHEKFSKYHSNMPQSNIKLTKNDSSLSLNLRKSKGELSIPSPTKKNCHLKMRQCKRCCKLESFCPECLMRKVIRRHLTGKSSQQEFQKFLIRCITNTSRRFRKLFTRVLNEVSKELGLIIKEINGSTNNSLTEILPQNIPICDTEGKHFTVEISRILKHPEFNRALHKIKINKTDATVQAVFNCSVEIQTLNDLFNGILHKNETDDQNKNSCSVDDIYVAVSEKKKGILTTFELKMEPMDENECMQIAIKKKKNKSDVTCNIL